MKQILQAKYKLVVPALMAAGVLAGCSSTSQPDDAGWSPLTCAVIGALVGGGAGAADNSERTIVGSAVVAGAIGAALCTDRPAPAEPEPLDSDADGVEDNYDDCQATPAGVQVDSAGCPLDSDADGVADYLDQCAGTPAGTPVDAQGCPEAAPVVVEQYCQKWVRLENGQVVGYRPVQFAFNATDFAATDHPELDCIADALGQQHDRLLIEGHTDSVGSAAYNQALSERRAATARQYLIDQGVSAADIEVIGYGETRPAYKNDTDAGRAGNRRIELKILD